jgi:penicillin-binding protein 1A
MLQVPKGGEDFQKAAIISVNNKKISMITEDGERGEASSSDVKWIWRKAKVGDVVMVLRMNDETDDDDDPAIFMIKQLPQVQGAIVVIDVETGRILAMQGGYSFSQSEFNRATQAMRQSGSAFKPFVYLAALDNGFAPNTVIDSSPVEVDLGESLEVWKPRNYQGAIIDKITLRRAIERSVNTATVRIAQEVGIDKIANIAERFGIFEKMPEFISFALGAGETTLLKLTTAYAMLANGGKYIEPTMVDYVMDKRGKVLYKSDNRLVDINVNFDAKFPPKLNDNRKQIMDERSVYQITSLLEGVMLRGSGASARFLNFPMAGKTGTSNESRDTWFIGYTPDIAIGVFVGFDEHSRTLGKNANGTNTALPIFIDFMKDAKKFLTPKPFRIPKGIKLRKIEVESGGPPTDNSVACMIEAFKEDEDNSQEPNITEIKKHKNILHLMDGNGDENNDNNNNENHDSSDGPSVVLEDDPLQEIKPVFGIY